MKTNKLLTGICIGVILFVIVIGGLIIRLPTFWVSHWMGDQVYYLCLAMKMEQSGLDDYNLRGLDMGYLRVTPDESVRITFPLFAQPGDQGAILAALMGQGSTQYDVPLFFNAPAFPFMLMLSHKLFADPTQPYAVIHSLWRNAGLVHQHLPFIFKLQFYAVTVPLFFNLATIILIFFLGNYLFHPRAGLYAALIYALDPVGILSAQRIWADDMLTFFVCGAVFLFLIAWKKQKWYLALCAGVSCGVAVITKQTGVCLILALWVFTVLAGLGNARSSRNWIRICFNQYFLVFLGGVVAVSFFWFYKVATIYGTPFYIPKRDPNTLSQDVSGWFKLLAQRPHAYIFFAVGIPCLCPLFAWAYVSIKDFWRAVRNCFARKPFNERFLMLWLWILAFYLLSFAIGKEERYMLPIHPPLAMLAGYYLMQMRNFIQRKVNVPVAEISLIALFIACGFWVIPYMYEEILLGKLVLLRPFGFGG